MSLRARLRRPAGAVPAGKPTAPDPERPMPKVRAPGPPRVRRTGAAGLTTLATLLVAAALVLPDELDRIGPAAVLRIPVEALVAVALLLVLPGRARRSVATLGGLLLGLLAVLKLLDMGFFLAWDRPFDVLLDWRLFDDTFGYLADSAGRAAALAAAAGAPLLAVGLLVLVTMAVLRLTRLLTRHRAASARVLAALFPEVAGATPPGPSHPLGRSAGWSGGPAAAGAGARGGGVAGGRLVVDRGVATGEMHGAAGLGQGVAGRRLAATEQAGTPARLVRLVCGGHVVRRAPEQRVGHVVGQHGLLAGPAASRLGHPVPLPRRSPVH